MDTYRMVKNTTIITVTKIAKHSKVFSPLTGIGRGCRFLPIGKDEWKSGIKNATFEERILEFLKTNQNNAFSLAEIVTGLGYKIEINDLGSFVGGVAGYWLFQNAIENLVKQGVVEGRKIRQSTGEQIYYKAI